MSFFDRLFGDHSKRPPTRRTSAYVTNRPPAPSADQQAVERYRYLLQTAPPEAIEQAHVEAFAQLTPEQRRLLLESLNDDLPPLERTDRDDPRSLARLATRTELRQPGTLERKYASIDPRGAAAGGGFLGGSFLSTIAAVVIGSAIADAVFGDDTSDSSDADGNQDSSGDASTDPDSAAADTSYDGSEPGYDSGNDFGGDFGGEFGIWES